MTRIENQKSKGVIMKTVFALFWDLQTAQLAVKNLLRDGFVEEQMNAIAQELVAKELEITDPKTMVLKTDQLGPKKISGLPSLFAGKKGISISDVGRVLASGTIAVELSGGAAVQPHGGLKLMLQEFSIPEEIADTYIRGLMAGGVLFCLRIEDIMQGKAIQLLKKYEGDQVYSVQPSTPTF